MYLLRRQLTNEEAACLANGTASAEYRAHLEALRDWHTAALVHHAAVVWWHGLPAGSPHYAEYKALIAPAWSAYEAALAAYVAVCGWAGAPPNWKGPWRFGVWNGTSWAPVSTPDGQPVTGGSGN